MSVRETNMTGSRNSSEPKFALGGWPRVNGRVTILEQLLVFLQNVEIIESQLSFNPVMKSSGVLQKEAMLISLVHYFIAK